MILRPAFILILALTQAAHAQELPWNVFALPAEEEVEDILVLGPSRPTLIRLHIRVDGVGHISRWRGYVDRLHARADLNRDGVVDLLEARKVVEPLGQPQQGVNAQPGARARSLLKPFENALVSRDGLAERVRQVLPPFRVEREAEVASSNDAATFRLLDQDGDGSISRAELAEAAASLARLDADDDGTFTAEELGPYRNPFVVNASVAIPRASRAAVAEAVHVVALSEEKLSDVALLTLDRYNRSSGRDWTLQPAELPVGRETFARLDRDGDGSVDAAELERALGEGADLDLVVRLGRRDPGQPVVERLDTPGVRPPFGAVSGVRSVGDATSIELDSTHIELRVDEATPSPLDSQRRGLERQFRQADRNGNGQLDAEEYIHFPPPADVVGRADRDGDGRLTVREWAAYLDDQAWAHGMRTVLNASEKPTSVFDLLDGRRDGRITARELIEAPGRVMQEDHDGDGRISRREFAQHHRWTISRGQGRAGFPTLPAQVATPPARPTPPAPDAPAWFLKMDRDGDGDLSPREFLGNRATFDRYDADRDGLIDPIEAARPLSFP